MQSFNFKMHRIEFYIYLKMFILFYKSLIFSKESDKMHWLGTDGRAVECTGLENRRLFTEFVSSNLTPSAIQKSPRLTGIFCMKTEKREMRTHEVSSVAAGDDAETGTVERPL